jgi:hypothetical protein
MRSWNSGTAHRDSTRLSLPVTYTGITVIQLPLNDDGQREGKLATPAMAKAGRDSKTFLFIDYDKRRVVLTDVRRDRVTG